MEQYDLPDDTADHEDVTIHSEIPTNGDQIDTLPPDDNSSRKVQREATSRFFALPSDDDDGSDN